MKLFLGLSVFLIITGASATRISAQEEAELRRENVYNRNNGPIHFNNDRQSEYNSSPSYTRPKKPSNEPVSLRLVPKPKYDNYKAVTNFSWQLFQLTNKANVENYVLSPLAPQLLLSHLMTGAGGATKNEIVRTIGHDDPNQLADLVTSMLRTTEGRELNIASAFFVSKDMKLDQTFLDNSVGRNVDVIYAPFSDAPASSAIVNKWVAEKTKNKISNLQLAISGDTRMIMTSAVYFSAKWLYAFQPAANEIFYKSTGEQKPVKMMTINKKFNYGKINNDAEWISIPYDSAESMVIILPSPRVSLDNLIRGLSHNDFVNITENIYKEETQANVDITMPTFSISSIVSLVQPFREMGMPSLFSPDADFKKLTNTERVQLSNAQQQSILEVNEVGTVAASLTSFSVVALSFSAPVPSVKITINRPFLCMIVDRDTNIPLFVAKVSNPQ